MKTDLTVTPFVGKTTKEDLLNIGITCVEDLVGQDPQELYDLNCLYRGYKIDRCQLYVFRLAVYYAENEFKEEAKLKWWYWKDTEQEN